MEEQNKRRKLNNNKDYEEKKDALKSTSALTFCTFDKLCADVLQHTLQYLSLNDRLNGIELVCKRLRNVSRKTNIHYNIVSVPKLLQRAGEANALRLANILQVPHLHVSETFNMQIMHALAKKTNVLFAMDWTPEIPLNFVCPRATKLHFGQASAEHVLSTHQTEISTISFDRAYIRHDSYELMSSNEWKQLQHCLKSDSHFELHLIMYFGLGEYTKIFCHDVIRQLTHLVLHICSVYSSNAYRFHVNQPLIHFRNEQSLIFPKLETLEIKLWEGTMHLKSITLPNLKKLIIRLVGNTPLHSFSFNRIAITHELDHVILIMTSSECKASMENINVKTKNLTLYINNVKPSEDLPTFTNSKDYSIIYSNLLIKHVCDYKEYTDKLRNNYCKLLNHRLY